MDTSFLLQLRLSILKTQQEVGGLTWLLLGEVLCVMQHGHLGLFWALK